MPAKVESAKLKLTSLPQLKRFKSPHRHGTVIIVRFLELNYWQWSGGSLKWTASGKGYQELAIWAAPPSRGSLRWAAPAGCPSRPALVSSAEMRGPGSPLAGQPAVRFCRSNPTPTRIHALGGVDPQHLLSEMEKVYLESGPSLETRPRRSTALATSLQPATRVGRRARGGTHERRKAKRGTGAGRRRRPVTFPPPGATCVITMGQVSSSWAFPRTTHVRS